MDGSKQHEAESWKTSFGLTKVDYIGKQPHDPSSELCFSKPFIFNSIFSPASNVDGDAEHPWATQIQTRLDVRNIPQYPVLPEIQFNGDYGLHCFNAVQSMHTDEAAYHFTRKHLTPLEMADTMSSDPVLVDSPNFSTPFGGVPGSEDSTSNLQDYSATQEDSNHSGVIKLPFLEHTLCSSSESAENWIPDSFFSALAESNNQQDQNEPCRHHLGAVASRMQAPENELPSLPVFDHVPQSAEGSQVHLSDVSDFETRPSYISQSTLGWNPIDVDVGNLFQPEAFGSHLMLHSSAESVPNALLSEIPGEQRELPTAVATVEVAAIERDRRKRQQESPKRSRARLTKPKLDDFLLEFDLSSEPGTRKRTRKAFSSDERKKVNAVRKTHACISCQSRKTSCSMSGVCDHCLKAANDPLLARQICLRTKLKDTFIGVKAIHGSLDARRGELEPILRSLTGSPVEVVISVICSTESGERVAELPLEVRGCSASPNGLWKSLGKAKGIYLTCDSMYDQRYVVVPSSLPSIDEVDQFGRKILSLSSGSHSGEITRRLDDFLLLYCGLGPSSPLRRFSNSTLRVVGLNGLVSYGFLNFRDGSYKLLERSLIEDTEDRNFISPTVNDQIRLLAAEGLKPTEEFLFAEIDRLGKMVGSSKHARIVAGICLMRLLLLYRDRAIRDEIRLSLPIRQKLIHRNRLEQSTFMYKRLTIAYGTLCRKNDSPLTSVYESEPDIEAGEHDIRLRASFLQLAPAYREFCENLTQRHDDVFKGLIPRVTGKASIYAKRRRLSRHNR